jgi:hypothetical protein
MAEPNRKQQLIEQLRNHDKRAALIAKLQEDDAAKDSITDQALGTGRSALESATLGISEPLIGRAKALYEAAPEAIQALVPGGEEPSWQDVGGEYSKGLEEDKAQRAEFKEKHPYLDTAGQVAGFFAPVGPAAAAFKVGAKGVKAIGSALPGAKLLAKAAEGGLLAKTGAAAVKAAGENVGGYLATEAASAPVRALSDYSTDEGTGDIGEGVVGAAKYGAGFGAGATLIPGAGRLAAKMGRKGISAIFGGVPEDTIKSYEKLLNESADSVSKISKDSKEAKGAIQNIVDNTYQKAVSDVQDATITYDQAKDTLDHFKNVVDDTVKTKRQTVKEKFDAAKEKLKEANDLQKELLKQANPPAYVAGDIIEDVGKVKQKLVEESKKATDMLNNRQTKISISPIVKKIDDEMSELTINGKLVGDADKATYSKLEELKSDFSGLGETVDLPTTKKLLKKLDDNIEYNLGAGEFNSVLNGTMKNIRGALRQTLGEQVPEFDQHMRNVVQPLGELREKASQAFKNQDAVFGKVLRIDSPKQTETRALLEQMSKVTGRDYLAPVGEYLNAQKTLKSQSALKELRRGLPEYQDYKSALTQYRENQKLKAPDEVKQIVDASNEIKRYAEAQLKLKKAQEVLEPLKIFKDLNSVQKTKQIIAGSNPAIKARLMKYANVPEDQFDRMINMAKIEHEFAIDRTRGSRNVNLWGLSGSLGGMAGAAAGLGLSGLDPSLGVAGFIAGSMVDKYGGRMTQKIIQAYTRMPGIPQARKINRYFNDLPPNIKEDMRLSFLRSFGSLGWNNPVTLDKDQQALFKQDLMEDPSFTSSEKAKIISDMTKNDGEVPGPVLKKFMVGDGKEAEALEAQDKLEESRKVQQPPVTLKNVSDYAKFKRGEQY